MNRPPLPPDNDDPLFDLQAPGTPRTVYTVVAVLVVISLVIGMAGFALWDRIF
jgi:hypothetical protein